MPVQKINGIPVYEATISSADDGMMRVSLVDDPAVMSNFQKFKKAEPGDQPAPDPLQRFEIKDDEKRLVNGVLMRADFPIYRRDTLEDGTEFEYYLIYKADTIRQMAEKYLKECRQNNVNIMHEDGSDVNDVHMVQMFIKDSAKGVAPAGFDEIADGSLFAEYHVQNDEVWDQIKAGTFKGFSMEGYFNFVPESSEEYIDQVLDVVTKFKKNISTLSKKEAMGKMKKIKAAFAKFLVEMASVTTDKAILNWDGDEDLKAGDEVFILDDDGNKSTPENGDYKTEDKKIIVVEDGKVSEIKDDEAEVSTEGSADHAAGNGDNATTASRQANTRQSFFARIKQEFAETYNEKEKAMRSALEKLGYEYPYIYEASDEYCIIETWDDIERFFRFAVTWNADGSCNLGSPEEMRLEFVPAAAPAEPDKEPETNPEGENMKAMKQELETLRAQVAALSKEPAAPDAHQTYQQANAEKITNKHDRAQALAALVKPRQ